MVDDDENGCLTFEIRKGRFSFKLNAPYSADCLLYTSFMTAEWARIPYDVLDKVSRRIVNEVKHVNRIVYDITSKPCLLYTSYQSFQYNNLFGGEDRLDALYEPELSTEAA